VRTGISVRIALVLALLIASFPLGSSRAAAATCGNPAAPTTTIYLPNITKTLGGPSGWVTPFIVQNVGVANTDLEVSFFRFADGSLVACRVVSALAPATSFADFPNADTDLPADTQFSVVVKSFGAAVVSVVNEHQGLATPARAEALSYVGLSSGATKAYLPYAAKQVNGWLTTFVVQNLGTAVANVTATFISYDGTKTATLIRQIVPGRSAVIDPTVEPLLIAGTEYAGVLSSDQPIAAIVNAHNDAPTAAAPMGFSYNAVAQPQNAPVYVPAVARNADGVTRTTRLLVENAGTFDATPTLIFRTATGTTVTLSAPTPIRPGAAWLYDPNFMADRVTPCPPAGAPSCPANGTHALTVQGGAFAVVGASLTPTSAMGYIGSAGSGNRAYLPNVTRTLGGATGWTTPIVLESTGASSANLRWYRFSDGALITRQTVSNLVSGQSVTIDPRAVSALSDNTQYAVVVDAVGGTLAAIVTELNFQGGDGDMSYEGFAATVNAFPTPTALAVTPASVSVATASVAQLTAVVKDQFDSVMTGVTVTWTVNPPTLGTVSGTGQYTAGQVAGTGTITATAGTATSSIPLSVSLPQTQTVGGISFVVQSVNGADLFMETTMSAVDRGAVAAEVPLDVAAVQSDFARTYTIRPKIYVFQTTSTFTTGLSSILGLTQSEAASVGSAATGIWYNNGTAQNIGIDWQKQSVALPISAIRHELTHWMEHQITSGPIPAWFDEGNARSEEFAVANGQYRVNQNKFTAASMAATNTLFTLADMTDISVWNARPGLAGIAQYYAASQAAQFLRQDLGLAGVVRMLDLMAQGMAFETAYQTVSGFPFSSFASAYAQRVRLLSPSYPAIVTATDTARGQGLTILMYGFTPGSQVTLSISGAASNVPGARTIDAYGTSSTFLDSTWPTGNYTISVTYSGGTVTVNATKTSSILTSMLEDVGEVGPLETIDDAPGGRDWISSGR
jgi:peptidase MA superfamily protein